MSRLNLFLILIFSTKTVVASTYKDIEDIIINHCQPCHAEGAPADFLPFESFEQVEPNRELMIAALSEGRMPYGDPNFIDTDKGKQLLDWLENGEEFTPTQPVVPPLILKDPRLVTYDEILPILKRNCGGCHRPGGQGEKYQVLELSFLRKRAKKVWDELDERDMPLNNREFVYNVDGRILMNWLRYNPQTAWRH